MSESESFIFHREILGIECQIKARSVDTSMEIEVFVPVGNDKFDYRKIDNEDLINLRYSDSTRKSLYSMFMDDAWDELTTARTRWLTDKVGFQELPSTESV